MANNDTELENIDNLIKILQFMLILIDIKSLQSIMYLRIKLKH